MKISGLIVLVLFNGALLRAQTNLPGEPSAAAGTNAPALPMPRPPTKVDSDTAEFDLARHEAIYHGHVRVDDPQMKLSCERLVADLPAAGGRVNHIVADTNVVIDFEDNKGQTHHATGDRAVYVYEVHDGATNETVTLTGHPQIEDADGVQTGDLIRWDRGNDKIYFENYNLIYRKNLNGAMADTHSPVPIIPPPVMVKTNDFPPGTVESTGQPAPAPTPPPPQP